MALHDLHPDGLTFQKEQGPSNNLQVSYQVVSIGVLSEISGQGTLFLTEPGMPPFLMRHIWAGMEPEKGPATGKAGWEHCYEIAWGSPALPRHTWATWSTSAGIPPHPFPTERHISAGLEKPPPLLRPHGWGPVGAPENQKNQADQNNTAKILKIKLPLESQSTKIL